MYNFSKTTYSDIILKLTEVEKWLNSISITTQGTIFKEICDNINLLDEYHKKENIEGLLKITDWNDLYYSLLNSCAFTETYDAFVNEELPPDFAKKAKEFLNLPLNSLNESSQTGSNNPRNYLFEYQMIARFRRSNSVTILGYDDIDIKYANTEFNVQCKRIYSDKKIERNIKKAKEQIQKRINGTGKKGIICLAIEKLVDTEGKILEVDYEAEIGPATEKVSNSFIKENQQHWMSILDTQIHAVFVFFQGVAHIKERNLLTNCFLLSVCPIVSPKYFQTNEYETVKNLAQEIYKM